MMREGLEADAAGECPRLVTSGIAIVGMLRDCPLDCLLIDKLVVDGGIRVRYIRDGVVLGQLKKNGFIDGVSYLKVVEVHWTEAEWAVYCTTCNAGMKDPMPIPLMVLNREVNLICYMCVCVCVCICVWVCVCVHERDIWMRFRTWTTHTVGSSLLLETTASHRCKICSQRTM